MLFSNNTEHRLAYRFDDSQHDTQEFLVFLLGELDNNLTLNTVDSTFKYAEGDKRPCQKSGALTAASGFQPVRFSPSCSTATSWFQGTLGSVMCSSCCEAIITNDHFMCLSLPIPIGRVDELGLDHCLEEFFKTEVLKGEKGEKGEKEKEVSGWRCSRCSVGKEQLKI